MQDQKLLFKVLPNKGLVPSRYVRSYLFYQTKLTKKCNLDMSDKAIIYVRQN